MIPKIIHYCWFGDKPKSKKEEKCIASWKKWLPEYKFIEWNESNFDVSKWKYAQETYDTKKYAFLSDVLRAYALYKYGGIYMDVDIEVLKPLDAFLKYNAFTVIGKYPNLLRANFLGARAHHPWFKSILDQYKERKFIKPDGSLDLTTSVCFGEILDKLYGYKKNGKFQILKGNIALFPFITSGAYDCETGKCKIKKDSYVIHWNTASFWDDKRRLELERKQKWQRKKIFRLFGVGYFFSKIETFFYIIKTCGLKFLKIKNKY